MLRSKMSPRDIANRDLRRFLAQFNETVRGATELLDTQGRFELAGFLARSIEEVRGAIDKITEGKVLRDSLINEPVMDSVDSIRGNCEDGEILLAQYMNKDEVGAVLDLDFVERAKHIKSEPDTTQRLCMSVFIGVDDFVWSARTANVVDKACIKYIGDLVQYHEKDLLAIRGCGEIVLNEIKEHLALCGLELGMELPLQARQMLVAVKTRKNE